MERSHFSPPHPSGEPVSTPYSGDDPSFGEGDDQGIPPPTLTRPQLEAVRRIAAQEDGAWARASFDGTAEAFSAHRGGLRRFAISQNGAERFANEIPPTTSFRGARLAVLVLLVVAAVSAGGLILSTRGGEDVGLWWLGPVGYVAVAFLIAAAFFGMHARLPASSPHYGEWVGLPGPSEGDFSGHTMPGLVKARPGFCVFYLLFFLVVGVTFTETWLGGAAAVAAWWVLMLCYSRGWMRLGDD